MKRKNIELLCWILTGVGAILILVFRHTNHSVMWFGLGLAIASLVISMFLEPIKFDTDNEFYMDDDYSVFEEENDEDD